MNDGFSQATSAPYSADNLKPHDENLVWSREFGTETLETAGDIFIGSAGRSTVNTVNARMGMLQVEQLNAEAEESDGVQGTTFLLPEWSSYPPSPIFGGGPDDPKAIVMYAHILKREANANDPDDVRALLMLVGEDFVGNVSAKQATAVGLSGEVPMMAGEEGSAYIAGFDTAGNAPTFDANFPHWGSNLYYRIIMFGDDLKETEATIDVGRDGLTWTPLAQIQIAADGNPLRRVGLGMLGGTGAGWLDWVRVYSYPAAVESGGLILPLPPLTGGRRFG